MTTRIRAKLGEIEFDAEGDAETINAAYAKFLAAATGGGFLQELKGVTGTTEAGAAAMKSSRDQEFDSGVGIGSRASAPSTENGSQHVGVTNGLFVEREGYLALKRLPPGSEEERVAAASLLLVCEYARRSVSGEGINGYRLRRALQQSGLDVERFDRVFDWQQVVTKGHGRGKQYQPTALGRRRAEELLRTMA